MPAVITSVSKPRGTTSKRLRRLPKQSSPMLRLNGLCPYYTMFPLQFPFTALSRAKLGDWVLDPFCGRGTTILAARLRGVSSVGIDSNPVAGAIASAKLAKVSPTEVVQLATNILEDKRRGPVPHLPHGDFWERCYAPETLRDICRIRNHLLNKCTTRKEVALRGLMLGILHGPINKGLPTYLSNQMPRTYSTKPVSALRYWKRQRLKPPTVDVLDAIERRAVFSFSEMPPTTLGRIVCGDSRTFNLNQFSTRFSWVITSPPYYGMRTYFPDHWLRNWFVGGSSDVEYLVEEQVCHQSEEQFTSDLAKVWKRTASACVENAKLICRFGALPSRSVDPQELLARSLAEADCGWKVQTVRKAGTSQRGRRQCEQFQNSESDPVEEIDVYAVMEG